MRLENPPSDSVLLKSLEDTFITEAMRNPQMGELNSSELTVGHAAMEQIFLLITGRILFMQTYSMYKI